MRFGDTRAFRPSNHSHRHKMALEWNSVSITAQHFTSCSSDFSGAVGSRALKWVLQIFPRPSPSVKEKKEWVVFIAAAQALYLLEVHRNVLQADLFKANISYRHKPDSPLDFAHFFCSILTKIRNRWPPHFLLLLLFSVFIYFLKGCWLSNHWRCVCMNRCPKYFSDWVSPATETESGS